jgi:GH25 family lysozyme M1 (1,4-beta-N-acetylmuramidase)
MKKTVLKILCVTAGVLLLTACAPQADPATSSSSTVPSTTTGPTTVPTTVIATTTKPVPQPNPYGPEDFSKDGQWMALNGAKVRRGIDVSAYQGDVNWQKVKNDGIEFVFVRIGFRGYGSAGNVVEDAYAMTNLRGAREAGLQVGAYFFSQAITVAEAEEEAEFALSILGDFVLDLPLVYDWEYVKDTARTANVTAHELTAFAKAYCAKVEEGGCKSMVYFNEKYAAGRLQPEELGGIDFWYAQYDGKMDLPYRAQVWQFSNTGRVSGIYGNVDLNIWLIDN